MATCTTTLMFRVIVAFLCMKQSLAMFEDQIGKFDWRHQYVGSVRFTAFEQSKHKRQIFVASESNVLASINLSGQLNWRHILRKGPEGVINAVLYAPADAGIVALSGRGRILREWNSTTGHLKWETPVAPESAALASDKATAVLAEGEAKSVIVATRNQVFSYCFKTGKRLWAYEYEESDSLDFQWLYYNKDAEDAPVYAIGVAENSHFVIVKLDAQSGDLTSQTPVSAVWASKAPNCVTVSGSHFVCTEQSSNTLQFLTFDRDSSFSATSPAGLGLVQLPDIAPVVRGLFPSSSAEAVFVLQLTNDHHALLEVKGQNILLKRDLPQTTAVSGSMLNDRPVVTTVSNKEQVMQITASYLEEGGGDVIYANEVRLPGNHGDAVQIELDIHEMRDKSISGRALIKTADDALAFVLGSSEDVVWLRDESLANAVTVELVDLPVSDTEARFEDEFGTNQGENILDMFAKRLSTQFAQFQSYIGHLKRKIESRHESHGEHKKDVSITHASQKLTNKVEEDEEDDDDEYMIRDEFNLHKVIVIVTKAGKIFGLDSQDGTIVWDHYLPDLAPFESSGKSSLPLFVQRTTAHFPNPPQCNLVGKSRTTGEVISFTFNPITGKPTGDSSVMGTQLPFTAKQAIMLNIMTEHFLKVMLYLDTDNNVHIIPASAASQVQEQHSNIFLFTADAESGKLSGYRLSPSDTTDSGLQAEEIWDVQLPTAQQRITQVIGKRHIEHVHSQGRVLGDRSVLYKYLNPNLVAVVTEGEEIGSKPHISVYLVDAVTGTIIFSADHKKVQGPVNMVHTENWVVYQYWNSRFRRNEITVLELFEGKQQKNSTLFSSLDPPHIPLVERQSYIIPSSLQAMAATYTEKGITARHLILSLASGGLLSMPKRFLDPRRPLELRPEHKEEGLIPYLPELPLSLQSFVNYNQSIFGVSGIQTSPAGLESTCLVLCYGLDFYFTRVMPSNLFDVLKEDFDYLLILAVLIGLVVAALSTRYLASRKALRQAWR